MFGVNEPLETYSDDWSIHKQIDREVSMFQIIMPLMEDVFCIASNIFSSQI